MHITTFAATNMTDIPTTMTTALVTFSSSSPAEVLILPSEVKAALFISIVFVLTTFIMLIYANRRFESDRAITVCCFLLTMAAQHITLATGLSSTYNKNICRAVALMIHYFELSEAFWTLGMIVQVVLKATYKAPDIGSTSQYCALGWITPLFVVASTAGLQLDKYGNERYCFLPVEDQIIFAFLVPGLLIVATNYTCLIYVIYEYASTKKQDKKNLPQVLSVVPNARALGVVSTFLLLDWTFFIIALRHSSDVVDALWASNKLLEFKENFSAELLNLLGDIRYSICIFFLFGVFSTEVQSEYERRFGQCCPWFRKSSRAVMDSPSPRPGWRDEMSQISNMGDFDNDSTAAFAGIRSNVTSACSNHGPGSANSSRSSSARATTISGSLIGGENGDAHNMAGTSKQNGRPSSRKILIDHKKARDALNESTSSIASTVASTLNLKAKLKVFPVRKLTDQHEHVKMTNTDQSDTPGNSREASPVPAPKKKVGWAKIMGGKT